MAEKISQGTVVAGLTRKEYGPVIKIGDTVNYRHRIPLSRGALNGMTLSNNVTDATNDIDFAAGVCRDSTDGFNIVCGAMTKRLDAAWAAGTNQGGLDTGAVGNGTYHCYAIENPTVETTQPPTLSSTGDFIFSLSATAPTLTLPGAAFLFRRIGSILREGGVIVSFTQIGDDFLRTVPIADHASTNPGTSAVTVTAKIPTGIIVEIKQSFLLLAGTGRQIALVTALAQTDTAPSTTIFSFWANTTAHASAGPSVVRSNTSAQFRYRLDVSDAGTIVRTTALGWRDRRGRDD